MQFKNFEGNKFVKKIMKKKMKFRLTFLFRA